MSSATINRPSGAVPSAVRATRFGDLTTVGGRSAGEDKASQGSTIGQSFPWQGSGGIWGNTTIGSGFANGKRDASRSRATDDVYQNSSGSSALAASSEADAWISRGGPWNDNASPTIPTPGSTSPLRNRSGPTMATETSPYLSTLRPTIGQVHVLNGRTPASNLDPASGSFKYSLPKSATFGFADEKENGCHGNSIGHGFGAYTLEHGPYATSGRSSQDNSGPPSRHSETGSNGTANGSIFSGHHIFSHTPNNSMQLERPSTQGRVPTFPAPSGGRSFIELTSHAPNAEPNFSRAKETPNGHSESTSEQPYQSHPAYPNFTGQRLQTGSSALWNTGSSASKGLNHYSAENYADGAFLDQLNSSKPSRLSDRESASPGNDRRQQHSPHYYPVNDSSLDLDPSYLRSLRPQSAADLEGRFQRLHFAPQHPYFPPHIIYGGQFQGQYPPHAYDFPPQHGFRTPYGYPMAPPFTPALIVPKGPARDQDDGHGVRSVLLDEFRCNSKSNRRYELKDIYNHVVEFSGDQHGSRFIQQKLETANSDEKDQIFREIQPNALQLMTDVFGNYVIQKLFEHGNQVQKRVLAETMKNHVNELSVQMYGCRVVQKALEHVLADQQAELVRELQHDILKCVKDQNGNHVIQKAIERLPTEDIQFIIEAFKGQVHSLATHPYGCRVIQRMLEYCSEKDQAAVLEELHACAPMLITDQYGNYVMQHVIAHGKPEDRARVIKIVTSQLLTLSKHKFASNVVEKTIQFGSDEQRRAIVAQLTALQSDGSSPLQLMMKDQYGNYVIQKLLAQLKSAERDRFIDDMKPQLAALKKYNNGKQITAIEKLISVGVSQTPQPLQINSSAATPALTMEQNSPESSGIPSTNASAVDGPTRSTTFKSGMSEKGMPEVRIETVQ